MIVLLDFQRKKKKQKKPIIDKLPGTCIRPRQGRRRSYYSRRCINTSMRHVILLEQRNLPTHTHEVRDRRGQRTKRALSRTLKSIEKRRGAKKKCSSTTKSKVEANMVSDTYYGKVFFISIVRIKSFELCILNAQFLRVNCTVLFY